MTFNLDSTSQTLPMVWIDPAHFRYATLNGDPFVQINLQDGLFEYHLFPEGIIFQVGNTILVECFNMIDAEVYRNLGRNTMTIKFEKVVVTDIA